ncbi:MULTISPECIES: TDT family transporter [unclassified Streptomyces]|jgi:tellurite resistance protein|uniref:SLAC1 family transporter n=1 Tax=unclassified Streptomyces TaxID=2593676 RepID=UPI00088194BB|nr:MULTISPECIES: TDT family transporter [unclassified Streptomyces]SCY10898.1 tellurite resistance protein [Streptomyces sp. 136MFCol5.1]SFS91595.1 tellurite resistance protein [Streptomyces sp. ok210]
MAVPRIPLAFFGISLGLAGLAGTWLTAAHEGHVPIDVGRALVALAAVVWCVTLLLYVRYAVSVRGAFVADMLDSVGSPFGSLAVITPMLLAAQGIAPYAPDAGRIVVDVFIVLTLLVGGWYTGQWIYGPLELDQLHPGYFLPATGGGLVAAFSAVQVGQERVAEVMFGLGIISWVILGSMILARLYFRPPVPPGLTPTLAIEVVPASMASVACFALNHDRIDRLSAVLAGYCLLMILTQVRLLPLFLRLRFTPGFWAFTFSWTTVATTGLHWTSTGHPPGELVLSYLLLAAATALVGAIAVRTLVAMARHQFLPPATPPPASA